ncbi:MAG: plastocyanin/azurin family copper-binding protein [Acidimicrobiia bacterium]
MLRKTAILIAIAMIAAACGGGATDLADDATAAGDTPATVPAADTHDDAVAHDDDDAASHDDDGAASHDDDAASHDDDAASHDDDAAEAGRTVQVAMAEFVFNPTEVAVSKGETVLFEVTNDGAIEHEFRLTTEHGAMEHMAAGHQGHGDEAVAGEPDHGEVILLVAPGETGTITVTFDHDADFDLMACMLPGHYEAGMHAPLTLEG